MSHGTLIFNPVAGAIDWRRMVKAVDELCRHRGWSIELQSTARPGHATELARTAARHGHKLVLAAGGDGTINEVVNGLVGSETILAPLPIGTANCLAKELRLPQLNLLQRNALLDATAKLLDGTVHAVDIGQCQPERSLAATSKSELPATRYWLLWASVGFDSYVVHHVEPRSRQFKRFGKLAYTAKTLSLLPGFSGIEARVKVDSHSVEGEFLLINVSNARWFAGGDLRLNPTGVLDDGLFEVWLIRGHAWPDLLRSGIDIVRQIHPHQPQVDKLRGQQIEIITKRPYPTHLDGELAYTTPIRCALVPKALQLLTPTATSSGLFSYRGERLHGQAEVNAAH
ncbi:MAG: diacylglycerol kinase family protein [Caldilineaceae bacterium]